MEQNQEYYQSWLRFFDKDVAMKKELSDLMPDVQYVGDRDYATKVSDRLYDGVRDLKMMLFGAAGPFLSDEDRQYINDWARNAQTKIAEAGLDLQKLHKAYMDTIGNMSPEFVKSVNENVFGYALDPSQGCPITQAKTFNEILHRMHVILERNNYMHERFPQSHDISENLTVFGEQTQLTKQLESSLALMFDTANPRRAAGPISIISVNDNSALIMIRDMGHATTIKVERENDGNIYLNYFIPKITNDDMVQQLPGLQSIAQTDGQSTYAVGTIATDATRLGIDTLELVYNIPTDSFFVCQRYDEITGTWSVRSDMPEEEHLFKPAEEILSSCVSTNFFQNFMDYNMEYACSEIGKEAIIRGYEREYPGYLMQYANAADQLPSGIIQSIQNGEFSYLSIDIENPELDGAASDFNRIQD